MQEQITFQVLPHQQTNGDSNWIGINYGSERVGIIRGKIKGNTITIDFLYIFDGFKGFGFGKRSLETLKSEYEITVDENDRWLYKNSLFSEDDVDLAGR